MAAGALRKVSPVVVRVNPRKVRARARASLRLPAKARVRVNLRLPVKDKGRANLRLQVKDRVKLRLRLQGKVKATKTVKTPLGKVNKAAGLLRPQPLF